MSIWEYERRLRRLPEEAREITARPKDSLWRKLARNAFYILAGAFFGYVIVFALGLAAIVSLDAAGVTYSDETGAYVIAGATLSLLVLGGWMGLRHGERR